MISRNQRPNRLHHYAYVSSDLEATRQFYEEIVGLPLSVTWCEGEGEQAYCHAFFDLEDGSSLAFFQLADPSAAQAHLQAKPSSAFYHVALNATQDVMDRVAQKAKDAGHEAMVLDHGYCASLYLTDPDGLIVELTVDNPKAAPLIAERQKDPHKELANWLAGDHSVNNVVRNA